MDATKSEMSFAEVERAVTEIARGEYCSTQVTVTRMDGVATLRWAAYIAGPGWVGISADVAHTTPATMLAALRIAWEAWDRIRRCDPPAPIVAEVEALGVVEVL